MPLHSHEFDEAVEGALEAWQSEMGFRPGPIRVRAFADDEECLSIEPLPNHYRDFLEAPELNEPDPEERQNSFEMIEKWLERGSFVLYWGNDLYLNGVGTVDSS